MNYIIVTDSTANLTYDIIEKYNITVLPLCFRVGDTEYYSYKKGEKTDLKQYYDMMRNKEVITTSLATPDDFEELFTPILETGADVLYIGFSSALSGTFQSATIAASNLSEQFPDRQIVVFDSLSASLGEGLLVYYAAKMQQEGKSLDEVTAWLEEYKLNMCHWFTVDDLFFLKRGGRVSAATAVIGSMLSIKPVLHVDDNGKLIAVDKARGRKQAMNAILKQFEETAITPEKQTIFISHGDCLEDAQYLEKQFKEKYGIKDVLINYIDPVIGAHSGPGTLAVFFLGTKR